MVEQGKQYELITVEAAIYGDCAAALHALVTHSLGPTEDLAGVVLDDMLQTNRQYLPRFFL